MSKDDEFNKTLNKLADLAYYGNETSYLVEKLKNLYEHERLKCIYCGCKKNA